MSISLEKENIFQNTQPSDGLLPKDTSQSPKKNSFASACELLPLNGFEEIKSEPKSILGEKDLNMSNVLGPKNLPTQKPLKKLAEIPIKAPAEPEFLKDVLKLNVQSINFGNLYPGSICEHNLDIFNKNKNNLSFKIRILCLNETFNELDEYVFSMRRTGGYEYNDNFLIVQAPWVKSMYKVAIKIPCVHNNEKINGLLEITSQNHPDKIEIPLNTNITIPKLVSERMMLDQEIGCYHMKFGLKNPKRQDFKISFRNKG